MLGHSVVSYPVTPPGSSVGGILQARKLEWVPLLFSRVFSLPENQTQVSHRFFTIEPPDKRIYMCMCIHIYTHTHITHIYIYKYNIYNRLEYMYAYVYVFYPFIHCLTLNLLWCLLLWIMLQQPWKCRYCFKIVVSFLHIYICPGVVLLYHMVALFLIFWGPSILFSQWPYQFTFCPIVYKGSLLYIFSPAFVIFCLFCNSHFKKCEVVFNFGFDFIFPNDKLCWAPLNAPVGSALLRQNSIGQIKKAEKSGKGPML